MPNVHMQTAARDLQRAVADLRQKEHDIRSNTDTSKHEINQRIADLRTEDARLRMQISQTADPSVKTVSTVRVANINTEMKDLEKRLFLLEDETRRALQDIENEAIRIDGLSKRLENMA